MDLLDLLVQLVNYLLRDLVGADCHTKVVSRSLEHLRELAKDIVIQAVHAEVDMLELGIFDGDPLLDLLSSLVLANYLFNIIELGHWLLRLLRRFQLLVLLNYDITLL